MKTFALLMALSLSFAHAKTVLFLGDSLTEGYGIDKKLSYPELLLKKFKKEGKSELIFVNASISGSTSASAPSRLRWFMRSKPQVLVLALGANDGLRGVDLKSTKKNLQTVIDMAKKNKVTVILLGLRMPPNYGKEYTENFQKLYRELAKENSLVLVPQLLEGVAGVKELNQDDGIHPNEAGHQKMMDNVYPHLKKLL
jgi:acyl-CoA thioesterase-1